MLLKTCLHVQDLLKCSDDEILALSIQKLHPALDSAFRDAGMPIEQSSASSGNNLSVAGSLHVTPQLHLLHSTRSSCILTLYRIKHGVYLPDYACAVTSQICPAWCLDILFITTELHYYILSIQSLSMYTPRHRGFSAAGNHQERLGETQARCQEPHVTWTCAQLVVSLVWQLHSPRSSGSQQQT